MDTRWKRFRYGTEERNPSWSFWGAMLGVLTSLFFCAIADDSRNLAWLLMGVWMVILGFFSLRHMGGLMRNDKKNIIPLELLDKTYPDLILVVFISLLIVNWYPLWHSYLRIVHKVIYIDTSEYGASFALVLFTVGTIFFFALALYLSVVRHLVREKLRKELFFYQMRHQVHRLWTMGVFKWREHEESVLEQSGGAKLLKWRYVQILAMEAVVFLLVLYYLWEVYWDSADIIPRMVFLCAVIFVINLVMAVRISKEIGVLLDEISYIAEDREEKIEPLLHRYSLFRRSEEELLAIQENKRENMEKRLQSERMKVELVTNVSHDLKTPLTSMIGCIDLLRQVEELPEEAKDYVNLLTKKAERLREMIQDVFEIAKAASGGQDLQMERLDMVRLLRQTIADMQDKIEASGLSFRVKTEAEELYFMGDGKKLYRVYQNLLENALKYSMEKSRVYVEVRMCEGRILTSVKNTSACEMDFTAEEIMERFTRGDKSRSTEGNGLGIAIAKSFTEACGGSFELILDGDLFKVETDFEALNEKF